MNLQEAAELNVSNLGMGEGSGTVLASRSQLQTTGSATAELLLPGNYMQSAQRLVPDLWVSMSILSWDPGAPFAAHSKGNNLELCS